MKLTPTLALVALGTLTLALETRSPRSDGVAFAKAGPNPPGASPPPLGPCEGHLTRAADQTITMTANQAFYKSTLDVSQKPPVTTTGRTTAIVGGCVRSVTDVVVPSTASSGCSSCYDFAEISLGAAQFRDSKSWEEHFYTMKTSAAEAYCKSYRHEVSVYRKKAGEAKFTSANKHFVYQGRFENGQCRVYAKNGSTVHDTTEVYAGFKAPASGTDVYRLVHRLTIDGQAKNSITVVEFEELER